MKACIESRSHGLPCQDVSDDVRVNGLCDEDQRKRTITASGLIGARPVLRWLLFAPSTSRLLRR
jgi:hypothetical protein